MRSRELGHWFRGECFAAFFYLFFTFRDGRAIRTFGEERGGSSGSDLDERLETNHHKSDGRFAYL